MPRCLGGKEESIHISQVDMIVEGDNPPMGQLGGGGAATEVDQAVGKADRGGDPERRLPAAGHRRHAQRRRLADCPEPI